MSHNGKQYGQQIKLITKVSTTKFGVILNHNLKWLEHISYVKNKTAKSIGIL